ncbi:MAG: DUF962 domain-containing protein [Pseudomonadota bacterium]|nr:DUF962 domain-containing protein [Pseudomonadota bacterium]QKK06434.1 MAG: DUF962 domain-containing protein [Pseudomonadota bacterium]
MTENQEKSVKAPGRHFGNYGEFWDFYLQEHSRKTTRAFHIAGTALGLATLAVAAVTQIWALPLVGLGLAYGAAWTSHALVERNRPATFAHPLWSFISDFRMAGLWCTGKLQGEIDRACGLKQFHPGETAVQSVKSSLNDFKKTLASSLKTVFTGKAADIKEEPSQAPEKSSPKTHLKP